MVSTVQYNNTINRHKVLYCLVLYLCEDNVTQYELSLEMMVQRVTLQCLDVTLLRLFLPFCVMEFPGERLNRLEKNIRG